MSEFDFTALFNEDYLYFYEPHLTSERNEREVNLIWTLLQLQAEMTVLDLACGHGRIANLLAQRGCSVSGLDATALFLEKARQDAQEGIDVEYIQGDMRSLPWTEHFDCIINWFTAFGYFDDEDNRKVLAEAYRALKPGGKLLIELQSLYRILKEFQANAVTERDCNYLIDCTRFDVFTNRTYTERIIIRDGQVRQMNYFVRHFTFTELRDWLLQTGFQEVQGYGNNGEPMSLDSRRMIVLAIK
ncbi:class I SAM-dependent methyltransferase [Gloeocapsopsis crepidinum LEGE 06123]|uniref:Class I SAM-dependent methyltransferase n=1 Tax=Gloeocapsopsis crepidinum LEGE 06123 TaxID=588587 RepID=A0ABR9URW5_9CHRO|nr:class I SAM-dependent methyltransferase [Gloeocapsopsis crepidinum]MBE9191028.1 class I SAM-dependent methyltransferase [Gloeocapsopsis crepidinum LEGE 06123]